MIIYVIIKALIAEGINIRYFILYYYIFIYFIFCNFIIKNEDNK